MPVDFYAGTSANAGARSRLRTLVANLRGLSTSSITTMTSLIDLLDRALGINNPFGTASILDVQFYRQSRGPNTVVGVGSFSNYQITPGLIPSAFVRTGSNGKIPVGILPNQVVLENELGAISVQRIPNTIARVSQLPPNIKVASATVSTGGRNIGVSRNVLSAVRRNEAVSRVTFRSGTFTRPPTVCANAFGHWVNVQCIVNRISSTSCDINIHRTSDGRPGNGLIDELGYTMIAMGNE